MDKIKKFLKNYWQLILVFILSFAIYTFFGFYINNGDPLANFGFSHAIRNGQIIYKDFNTISTPLYAFYCSLFLFIYDDFIMFIVAQAVLVTIMFFFLFKLLGNRAWVVYLSMIVLAFYGFNGTYNFCCLAMSVIVLYLETRYPKKDFLIGLFLGFSFLSKQTVGGLLLIPSFIICFKEWKRLGKRILGFLLPVVVLIIYLICNGALYEFIDLCFLGLFDFGSNNTWLSKIWFFSTIILLIINIIFFVRDRRVTDYYGFAYLGFVLPIFDRQHFAFYFIAFTIILMFHFSEFNKYKMITISGLIIEFILFNWLMGVRDYKAILYTDVSHFKYKYNYQVDYEYASSMNEIIDKYIEDDPILIMYYSMEYNISHDRRISYFDVFLYGNHGYNGTEKMISRIKNMNRQYFIIDMDKYETAGTYGNQFNEKIIDYIISVSELVDSQGKINVYYKE